MWVWGVPAGILMLAVIPMTVLLRQLAAEAAAVVESARGMRALQPALVEIRDEALVARTRMQQLRQR